MQVLLALSAAGAWLLMGAGVAKLLRPKGTEHALAVLMGVGNPRGGAHFGVRALGAVEVTVALGFVVWPGAITSLLVGMAYLAVFGSAWILRSKDADCGCFGEASAQVGGTHLVVTLLSALAALALTIIGGVERSFETYALVCAASTLALGEFALIGPLSQLKSRLADLRQ